jgi:DNA replication protein DnaC
MTDALDRLLRELHLPTVLAQAQTVAIEAERSGWSFTRYLYTLVELELEQRRQHRIQRRRKESGLPSSKTLTTLQVAHLPTPVRRQLPTLCEGQFVEQAQNVLAFRLPEDAT